MAIRLSNRRKASLSSLPEGQPRVPGAINLSRYAYYLVIALVFGYVLYYTGTRLLFVQGRAIISHEEITVKAPRPSLLKAIDVAAEARVSAGQRLLFAEGVAENIDDALALEALRAGRDQAQKAASLAALGAQLREIRKIQGELRLNRALELNRDRIGEAVRLDVTAAELEARIAGIRAEIAAYEGFRTGLAGEKARLAQSLQYEIAAPVAGQVVTVLRRPSEFVRQGETVLILKADKSYRTLAFFDQAALESLAVGHSVVLKFPDGSKGEGTIKRVHSAADDVSELLRENYRPVQPEVVAEIAPLNLGEEQLERFRNMEVVVEARRWQ